MRAGAGQAGMDAPDAGRCDASSALVAGVAGVARSCSALGERDDAAAVDGRTHMCSVLQALHVMR
jgi:hypothetical protein